VTNKAAPLEAALNEAQSRWKAWLRARYPTLSHLHAEFMQDAAADLTEYVQNSQNHFTEADLARIGFVILKRRVADLFRDKAARWSEQASAAPADEPAQSAPAIDEGYAKILRLVVGHIAHLSSSDRDLLLRQADDMASGRSAMSVAERQQLSRLRTRLRQAILAKHRIDIRAFLRDEL
jgi:hypothetical protein